MYRVSTTTLDSYQAYLDEIITKEQLIERLTKPFAPSIEMETGTAFHELMQADDVDKFYCIETDTYICNGYHFKSEIIRECRRQCLHGYTQELRTHELKVKKHIHTAHGVIELVAKADTLVGDEIYETKTNWSSFSYDKYASSWQWRSYCYLFGINRMQYQVFELRTDKSGVVSELKGAHLFNCSPTPDNEAQIKSFLEDFAYFIQNNNLGEYFKTKIEDDAILVS